jgi:hypothetical protein
MSSLESPTALKGKYTPPHLRSPHTTPPAYRHEEYYQDKWLTTDSPQRGMITETTPFTPPRKLSPNGNLLWCDMLDDDSLLEPLTNMAVKNLCDKTNKSRSDNWHTAVVKDQSQAG